MASFFRTSIYICLIIIVFTLSINFVNSLGAFNAYEAQPTDEEITVDNALEQISGLEGGMASLWALAVGVGAIGAIALVFISKQISPIGIYIFSTVFWTSWLKMNGVININGVMPVELMVIFTVAAIFLFIAAIIGMLTGSG